LIFLQYRRIIEGKDLPFLAIIALGIAFFLVKSQFPTVVLAAIVVSAGTVAVTALFRLVYQLLSHFLN
jgi:serine/threonine-protein kinase